MSEQFYTILTSVGQAKITSSAALGTKLNFVKFKVGDGSGAYYNPTESQIDVKNKVWEGNISSISVDESNPNWIVIETVIPTLYGGFTIREAGIFDDENNLIAIGKYPETYKPVAAEGSSKDLLIRMILEVSNAENINLKVDPTVILATKKDIQTLESKLQLINTQLSDMVYQVATGTATALTLTTQTLVNGYAKTFIASANNSGVATTINGKPLYKPGTTTAPNLIAGKAYTVWYNSTGNCFFIKASAEGTVTAPYVLAGYTFSNDTDTGLPGGMTNITADQTASTITQSGTTVSILVPKGYWDGTKKINTLATAIDADCVTGNIKAGVNIMGVDGKVSVVDTADATAGVSDILSTKTAYVNGVKVTGNVTLGSLGGKKYATATIPSNSTTFIVNGLTFAPSTFLIIQGSVYRYYANKVLSTNTGYMPGSATTCSITFTSDGFTVISGLLTGGTATTWYAWE